MSRTGFGTVVLILAQAFQNMANTVPRIMDGKKAPSKDCQHVDFSSEENNEPVLS